MNIKIKLLTETAQMPSKAHSYDACFDLYLDEPSYGENPITINPGETAKLHSGICTEIDTGFFAAVFPRSGLGINKNLVIANGTGIIDSNYRGEWILALYNASKEPQTVMHGDRVAQFAVLPVYHVELEQVEELTDSDRGTGGLGSSGTK